MSDPALVSVTAADAQAPLTDAAPVPARGWPVTLAALTVALLATIGLYWPTATGMASIWWRSDTFAHGMLVVPIVLYMLWTRRAEIAPVAPRPAYPGLALLALLAAGWFIADSAGVGVGSQLCLVAMFPALVWTLCGRAVVAAAAFPLAYLFFAVPIGEGLVPPLQDFTAHFTVRAVRLTGIPVYAEGWYLMLPSGTFQVAEACSGIRYLIASLALGCLYAYLTYRSPWRRFLFIVFAAIVPVLANGLRAFGIVMIAHFTKMEYATGADHLVYGWLFFGLVIGLMFWVGRFWEEDPSVPPVRQTGLTTAAPAPAAAVQPWPALVLSLCVLALAPLALWRSDAQPVASVPVLTAPAVAGWNGPKPAEWATTYTGQTRTLTAQYDDGRGHDLRLWMAAWAGGHDSSRMISSVHLPYKPGEWVQGADRVRRVPTAAGEREVYEVPVIAGERRLTIWTWYSVGGHPTVSPSTGKLWQAWNMLSGNHTPGRVFVLVTDGSDPPDVVDERLSGFLGAAAQPLDRLGLAD